MKEKQIHPFEAIYDNHSEILILGTFPSVKSRENAFYYGHPQNRFWKLLAALYQAPCPQTIEEKILFLQAHHIALWDVIQSCEIKGSADSSIQNVIVNDISRLIAETNIKTIYCNGKKAKTLFDRYIARAHPLTAIDLPSTSPANAAWSMERLIEAWQIIREQNADLPNK